MLQFQLLYCYLNYLQLLLLFYHFSLLLYSLWNSNLLHLLHLVIIQSHLLLHLLLLLMYNICYLNFLQQLIHMQELLVSHILQIHLLLQPHFFSLLQLQYYNHLSLLNHYWTSSLLAHPCVALLDMYHLILLILLQH